MILQRPMNSALVCKWLFNFFMIAVYNIIPSMHKQYFRIMAIFM